MPPALPEVLISEDRIRVRVEKDRILCFVNGEIDTPSGTLSISASGGLVLGILAGEPAKMNQLRKAAEEFATVTRSP